MDISKRRFCTKALSLGSRSTGWAMRSPSVTQDDQPMLKPIVRVLRDAGWCGAYGWVVEFRVLGPIEVYSDDNLVHVGGVKQRSILALLIANHGQVVSADRIVDEVYGEDAAAGARRSVQTIISMLRRDLGDVIVGTGDGYRFDAPRDTVDVCRFEDGVAAGLELRRG